MKLGVAGLLPGDWRKIDLAQVRKVKQAGFLGASLFIQKPLDVELDEMRRVKSLFQNAGLEIAQANGWYEALVNPDEGIRLQGIQGLSALVRIGALVGAPTTYVRPGGLNPRGHWYPHPENHSPATFDRLIDSLKKVSLVAESEGILLAIEGHVLSPLDSALRVRQLLDAVSSPALKFNTDPVNFIGTVKDVHHTRPVLVELDRLLGKDTVVGHAKDVALQDNLVVHIEEVLLGTGTMDYAFFLSKFQESSPDGYLLIEHLPDDKVPLARQALVQIATNMNIPLEF